MVDRQDDAPDASVILGEGPRYENTPPPLGDLGEVPGTMDSADAAGQDLLLRLLSESTFQQTETSFAAYSSVSVTPVSVKHLRRTFVNRKTFPAMNLLTEKCKITGLDGDEFCVTNDNPDLMWQTTHFLDYLQLVPASAGLHCILPPPHVNYLPNYSFVLNLNRLHWDFRGDRTSLFGTSNGKLLAIGDFGQENCWIFASNDATTGRDGLEEYHRREHHNSARMSPHASRVLFAFLAYCMEKKSIKDVTIHDPSRYPNVASHPQLKLGTNIMYVNTLQLTNRAWIPPRGVSHWTPRGESPYPAGDTTVPPIPLFLP